MRVLLSILFCCALAAQTVSHGIKFQPSATTAGAKLTCTTLPSSPANGDLACDSGDSNKVKVYSNGGWVAVGSGSGGVDPFETTEVRDWDDFTGSLGGGAKNTTSGKLGWRSVVIGAADCSITKSQPTDHAGVYTISHTGTTSGEGCMVSGNYLTNAYPRLDTGLTSWHVRFTVITPSDIADVFFGVALNNGTTPARGIRVRFDTAGTTCGTGSDSTSQWVYETIDTSSNTCVASGVSVAASTAYRIDISSTTMGTIVFTIDGANQQSITTNVPADSLGPAVWAVTRTTTTKSFSIDRYAYEIVY